MLIKKNPSDLDPEAFEWIVANQITCYEFKWFDGEQLPKIVKDVIIDKDDSEGTVLNIDKFNLFYYYFKFLTFHNFNFS